MRAQAAGAMYAAVFVFLGIESASTYSRYARRREDVGRATFAGFLLVLALVVAITVFSFGVLPHAELAGLRNPSTAYVLRSIVGDWGAYFISIALIISLLGAFLSWTLIAAEVLYVASKTGSMPRFLSRENRNKAPVVVVIHEIFGLLNWVRSVADQLAADGFIASPYGLVPSSFQRLSSSPQGLPGLFNSDSMVASSFCAVSDFRNPGCSLSMSRCSIQPELVPRNPNSGGELTNFARCRRSRIRLARMRFWKSSSSCDPAA